MSALLGFKACPDCGEVKELSAFANGGKYTYCSPCKYQRVRKWVVANRDRHRAALRACERRRAVTPEYKLRRRIKRRLAEALSGAKKGKPTFALLGYALEDLRAHLERQFLKGMSWENMGQWHIDHIVPLSSFTITGPDDPELRRAWALTNLRPMWAKENMSKGAKRLYLV